MKGNRLDQFDELCLFSTGGTLDREHRAAALACFQAYSDYDDYCFSGWPENTSVSNSIGLLFAAMKSSAGTQSTAKMLCTAMEIDDQTIVSARHCIDAYLNMGGGSSDNLKLVFERYYPQLDPQLVSNIWDSREFPPGVIAEELKFNSGTSGPLTNANQPNGRGCSPEEEFVGKTEQKDQNAYNLGSIAPIVDGVKPGDQLLMAGVNQLALRLHLLRARLEDRPLPSDADFIRTGKWTGLVRVDATPTCRAVVTEKGLIGHYCQTWNLGSGAPMFVATNGNSGGYSDAYRFAGIHVGVANDQCFSTNPKPAPNVGVELLPWIRALPH